MRRYLLAAAGVVLVVLGVGAALCRFTSLTCRPHAPAANVECRHRQCYTDERLGLPKGFRSQVVVSGLSQPASFAFLPDGRVLIAEKPGTIRVLKGGRLLPKPFLDIASEVNAVDTRGLLAVRPDPDFSKNGFVYAFYVHENRVGGARGPDSARLSRFTAVGDAADPKSEKIVLGGAVGGCGKFGRRTNCIPAEGYHSGADIAFAPDKTMFVSTGDDGIATRVDLNSFRAQDLDSLSGKILHVTKTGRGLPGNPFWTGNAGDNRSRIWAFGLRNPFRFGLQPGTNVPYVGDVGWVTSEEVDAASRGANLGWPCFEGDLRTRGFSSSPACRELYAQGASAVRAPLMAHHHDHRGPTSVTGGVFYTGTSYPRSYRGLYFYGDYGKGWVHTLQVPSRGSDLFKKGRDRPFARGLAGPVAFAVGSDGDVWVLSFSGELRRIVYTGESGS